MANFLLYGTTGYTGGLIARQALSQGLRPLIAGRTEAKLKQQATEWGVEYRVFSLDDAAAMDEALADVAVVLNTAGPFARTAQPLVEGCLRTKTHYLDIAGEAPEFEALVTQDEAAKAAEVMLMPGVGFGIVPTDCMAAHLQERLPSATHLTLAFETEGGVSQGTLRTLFKDLHKTGGVRLNGAFVPARPAEKQRLIDFGQGPTKAVLNPWRGDLSTAFYSTGIPNIETYSVFPGFLVGLMRASGTLGWLWSSGPVQGLLTRLIKQLPAGPSDEELATGLTRVWGEVTDVNGQRAVSRLHGPEAYLFTALTALAIVDRILAGQVNTGFQTPAQVFGSDFVLSIAGVSREDL